MVAVSNKFTPNDSGSWIALVHHEVPLPPHQVPTPSDSHSEFKNLSNDNAAVAVVSNRLLHTSSSKQHCGAASELSCRVAHAGRRLLNSEQPVNAPSIFMAAKQQPDGLLTTASLLTTAFNEAQGNVKRFPYAKKAVTNVGRYKSRDQSSVVKNSDEEFRGHHLTIATHDHFNSHTATASTIPGANGSSLGCRTMIAGAEVNGTYDSNTSTAEDIARVANAAAVLLSSSTAPASGSTAGHQPTAAALVASLLGAVRKPEHGPVDPPPPPPPPTNVNYRHGAVTKNSCSTTVDYQQYHQSHNKGYQQFDGNMHAVTRWGGEGPSTAALPAHYLQLSRLPAVRSAADEHTAVQSPLRCSAVAGLGERRAIIDYNPSCGRSSASSNMVQQNRDFVDSNNGYIFNPSACGDQQYTNMSSGGNAHGGRDTVKFGLDTTANYGGTNYSGDRLRVQQQLNNQHYPFNQHHSGTPMRSDYQQQYNQHGGRVQQQCQRQAVAVPTPVLNVKSECWCTNPDLEHAQALAATLCTLYAEQIKPTLHEVARRLCRDGVCPWFSNSSRQVILDQIGMSKFTTSAMDHGDKNSNTTGTNTNSNAAGISVGALPSKKDSSKSTGAKAHNNKQNESAVVLQEYIDVGSVKQEARRALQLLISDPDCLTNLVDPFSCVHETRGRTAIGNDPLRRGSPQSGNATLPLTATAETSYNTLSNLGAIDGSIHSSTTEDDTFSYRTLSTAASSESRGRDEVEEQSVVDYGELIRLSVKGLGIDTEPRHDMSEGRSGSYRTQLAWSGTKTKPTSNVESVNPLRDSFVDAAVFIKNWPDVSWDIFKVERCDLVGEVSVEFRCIAGLPQFIEPNDAAVPYDLSTFAVSVLYIFALMQRDVTFLKAGRFVTAQCLQTHGPAVLRQLTLGQLSHLVQLLLTTKFVAYDNHFIRPVMVCAPLTKAAWARLAQHSCPDQLVAVERVSRHIRELLKRSRPHGIVLSQLRMAYETYFYEPLEFNFLGHIKLANFLKERLSDVCKVEAAGAFNFVVYSTEEEDVEVDASQRPLDDGAVQTAMKNGPPTNTPPPPPPTADFNTTTSCSSGSRRANCGYDATTAVDSGLDGSTYSIVVQKVSEERESTATRGERISKGYLDDTRLGYITEELGKVDSTCNTVDDKGAGKKYQLGYSSEYLVSTLTSSNSTHPGTCVLSSKRTSDVSDCASTTASASDDSIQMSRCLVPAMSNMGSRKSSSDISVGTPLGVDGGPVYRAAAAAGFMATASTSRALEDATEIVQRGEQLTSADAVQQTGHGQQNVHRQEGRKVGASMLELSSSTATLATGIPGVVRHVTRQDVIMGGNENNDVVEALYAARTAKVSDKEGDHIKMVPTKEACQMLLLQVMRDFRWSDSISMAHWMLTAPAPTLPEPVTLLTCTTVKNAATKVNGIDSSNGGGRDVIARRGKADGDYEIKKEQKEEVLELEVMTLVELSDEAKYCRQLLHSLYES